MLSRAIRASYALRASAMGILAQLRPRFGKNTIIIFDPSLLSYNGHNAEFARLIKNELAPHSDLRFYSNYRATTRLVVELLAEPVCMGSVYSWPDDFGAKYRRTIDLFHSSLTRIRSTDLTPSTIVVVHTATIPQLAAFAAWYPTLQAALRPKLFFQFQHPLEFGVGKDRVDRAIDDARSMAATLIRIGHVRFAANSPELAERLAQQIDQPCAIMPLPIRWPKRSMARPNRSRPTFGFFGGLKAEKGASLIAEALPKFLEKYSDVHFIIHAPPNATDLDALQLLERMPRVQLIRRIFRDKEEYFAAFRRVDCILVPYSPEAYSLRTSGIFLEATGLGQFVLTTTGLGWAAEIREHPERGFVLAEFTASALLDGLEWTRRMILDRGFNAIPNQSIMEANSPSSFCNALLRLMDD